MKLQRVFGISGKNLFCTATALGCLLWNGAAVAADSAVPAIPKEKLYGLAGQFLDKVGGGLKKANLMMSGAGKVELAEKLSGSQIPEGEPLIMHMVAERFKIDLKQDVYAVKQGTRLMISLGEFMTAADLAVSVNPEEGRAEGWFIREDQRFFLDANKNEVTIMGQTEKLDPLDISLTGSDLLVSSALLEKWFGLDMQYDFSRLNIKVRTSQLLPVETKYLRGRVNTGNSFNVGPPKLPLQEEPYRMLSKPNIDVSTSVGRLKYAPDQPAAVSASWSTLASGDLAGYSAQAYASGNKQTPVTAARLTLTREDPEGNLLGPLHATSYQLGDVNTVTIPLIDAGGQEQGITLTNRPTDISTQSTTDIRGNAMPDWDVELYNNDSFVDIQHIDTDGQYDFKEVTLFAGNNDFKLLFYGPQGEIRQENRRILVDPSKFEQRKGYYALSATRQHTTTWEALPPEGADVGAAHLAASYAYGFGNLGTGSVGARLRSDNGEDRAFLQTGWGTYFYDTYINADSGYDLSTMEYGSSFGLRRNFGPQRVSLQFATNSEGFDPNNSASGAGTKYHMQGNIAGPLIVDELLSIKRLSYHNRASHSISYDGSTSTKMSTALSGRYKSVSLSTGLNYKSTSTDPDDSLAWSVGARGQYKGGLWGLNTSYALRPEPGPGPINAEYIYRINDKLNSKTELSHSIDPGVTEGAFSLNWQTDKAMINPRIAANTENMLDLRLNVRFGLSPEPYSGDYQMTYKSLSSVGGVSARLFMDMNGDGIYNQGEELLPDTGIKAAQSFRKAVSNERGIAFIYDLPVGIITDVSVDPLTFPDFTYLSLFDGVSVRPRPGIVSQIEFPIVVSGELDGTGYLVNDGGTKIPARNVTFNLTAPDGRVEKSAQAAYDGYYSITNIRPGVYYLNVDPTKSEGRGYMVPERVAFEPNGTTLYGHTPALVGGYDIPFSFRGLEKRTIPFNRARVEKAEDIAGEEVRLKLGPFHSRLGLTFAWYKFKIRSLPWKNYFSLVTPLSDIKADERTGEMVLELKPEQPFTMQEAAVACRNLQDMKFPCGVEVITYYTYDKERPPAVASSGVRRRRG